MKILPLATLIFLAFSYEAEAAQVNCESVAQQAYNEMLEYQITGKTDNKVIAKSDRVINFFDKKVVAKKHAWKLFDECKKGQTI